MKTKFTFKQSQQHGYFYAFIIILLLIVIVTDKMLYLFAATPLFIFFFRSYHITEMNTLQGNGTLAVATIERLTVKGHKVTAYYHSAENKKLCSRTYYVRKPKLFVNTLVEINPSIEICNQ